MKSLIQGIGTGFMLSAVVTCLIGTLVVAWLGASVMGLTFWTGLYVAFCVAFSTWIVLKKGGASCKYLTAYLLPVFALTAYGSATMMGNIVVSESPIETMMRQIMELATNIIIYIVPLGIVALQLVTVYGGTDEIREENG